MAQVHPGELRGRAGPDSPTPSGVIIDNRTHLPDADIRQAVMAQWVETAAFQFGHPTSFQMYATNQGSMLARTPFQTPANVIEEIKLARQVAETDDDVLGVIGNAIATAYGDGMQNQHEDERTVQLFNEISKGANLDVQFKELYREYLVTGAIHSVSLFTRTRLNFTPTGTQEKVQAQLQTPLIGVLPSENIRVVTTDLFGTGELAYEVTDQRLKDWLVTLFDKRTSEAVKARMRREQPVVSAIFTRKIDVAWDDPDPIIQGKVLFGLNPRMVHRTTMPKGASAYPRPPLTANYALLEAKRLLNIMDYALLQGGTNYIVVAKVGSDQKPGQQTEVDNLTDQVRQAARTGVLVGDHRISIEIITPDLTELLNPAKRRLIGRKLTMALLRLPEPVADHEDSVAEMTQMEKSITSDRQDIKRHVERTLYDETVARNPSAFTKGAPKIWHQKIVLASVKDFFDQVVKARDRGDIPRKWAVEILGFDYEAGVAQRKREQDAGHDEIMVPGSVPFDSPHNQLPGSSGGDGRPPGSSSNNGRPGSPPPVDPAQRQRRVLPRRRGGEPVRAVWNSELESVVRVGELTAAVLEEYPDRVLGRITAAERDAVNASQPYQQGPVAVVPVNPAYAVGELRAFRLEDGLAMIVGERSDGALVAKAISFREPHWTVEEALEHVMRWGFVAAVEDDADELADAPQQHPVMAMVASAAESMGVEAFMRMAGEVVAQALGGVAPHVTIVMPEEGDKEIIRDEETGAIIGTRRRKPEVTE